MWLWNGSVANFSVLVLYQFKTTAPYRATSKPEDKARQPIFGPAINMLVLPNMK